MSMGRSSSTVEAGGDGVWTRRESSSGRWEVYRWLYTWRFNEGGGYLGALDIVGGSHTIGILTWSNGDAGEGDLK